MPILSGRSVFPAFMRRGSSRLGQQAEGVGDLRRAEHREGLREGHPRLGAEEAVAGGPALEEVGDAERRLRLVAPRVMELRAVAADRLELLLVHGGDVDDEARGVLLVLEVLQQELRAVARLRRRRRLPAAEAGE